MERPACVTCPFAERAQDDGYISCHRRAPGPKWSVDYPEDYTSFEQLWPELPVEAWCGEHPDFPAYIAWLKDNAHAARNLVERGVVE